MPANSRDPAASILRPTLVASMVYVAACSLWFLWILCTVKFPVMGTREPFRLITPPQAGAATVVNVLLVLGLVRGGLRARKGPPSLRKAHLAGAALALVTLACVQACLVLAYGPIALPGGSLPIRSVLAIESLGERGRSPVSTDALEARLVRGEWQAPSEGETLRSATGEERAWTRFEADGEGWFRGAPFRGGWAFATVHVPSEGPWRLDASGHACVLVDGEPRAGDEYQLGITRAPMWLTAGEHELLFRCGRGALRAALEPAPATVYVEEKDPTLPDVLRGEGGTLLAGVIVANAGAQAARGCVLAATVEGAKPTRTDLPLLGPSSYRKCRIELRVPESPEAETLALRLELLDSQGKRLHATSLTLKVRDPDDVHVRTFESAIDGSVQLFALRPPAPGGPDDPDGPLDLILTLHGAGVDARRQAGAYRARPGVLFVAPTNRRPYGFDWEDWGRLDALEVLAQAEALYDTNPRRTYLTGHSMGGHGTWQLGVHFPDRFAAIAPSAGWRDFWRYGATPLDEADPIGRLLNGAANASRTLLLKDNLRQSGVYVLHGDADETVPVAEARAMRALLAEDHPDFAYHEEPGAGHWWGDECMDWPPLIDFLRAHELPDPRAVLEVDFTTVDPGISHRCQWVDVRGQEDILEPSRVVARVDPELRTIEVEATNIGLLGLHLAPLSEERDTGPAVLEPGSPILVRINGVEIELPFEAPIQPVYLKSGLHGLWFDVDQSPRFGWQASQVPAFEREPGLEAAFRHRMAFVYGTHGTPEENAWARAKARFDHETWRYRGNGAVDVVADVDFDPAAEPDRGVVLYGNRDTNAAWEALLVAVDRPAPFELGRGRLSLAGRTLEGDDLALLAVHPRQGSELASVAVVGGTGLSGMRATDHLPLFVSGVAWPTWTVIGAGLASEGLAAVRGAGWSWLADFQLAWR